MSPRIFPAIIDSVYDGDTCKLRADLGMAIWRYCTARLNGINAAELRAPGGLQARDHLIELMPPGTEVRLVSLGWDKYRDRLDAQLILPDGRDVSEVMVADGYAAAWDGHGEKPCPPWPIPEAC